MPQSAIRRILEQYPAENPGVKAHLHRLLAQGMTGEKGKLIIYAVDQGFEHGPMKSFAINPVAHDPLYHFQFAEEAKLSAFAAPLGLLEVGADRYAGSLPLILKLNSSNALAQPEEPDQALTASVDDALRLGCVGVGFTIYPGSNASFPMLEDLKDIIAEARAKGLFTVVWSYARGHLSSAGETATDVIAYGAHMACLMGAHIVKVKIPTTHLETADAKALAAQGKVSIQTMEDSLRYVVRSCFEGRRMVIFSGGTQKGTQDLLEETKAICKSGGAGSIIGRNIFQRPKAEALELVQAMGTIYNKKD